MIELSKNVFSRIFEGRSIITPLIFAFEYERVKQAVLRTARPGDIIPLDLDSAKKRMANIPKEDLRLSLCDFEHKYIRPMVAADLETS